MTTIHGRGCPHVQHHHIKNSSPRLPRPRAAAAAAAGLSGGVPAVAAAETSSPDPARCWLGKIKGKHKMVFDVTEPNGGFGVIWPRIYMNTMQAARILANSNYSAAIRAMRYSSE